MSVINLLILVAVIPVYLICRYVYSKDHNKESSSILEKLFIAGILSCFLVIIVTRIERNLLPFFAIKASELNNLELFVSVFFGVGLIEEFCKWTMVYFVAYKSREYDEVYDGIVYAAFVALGFAVFENIIYVIGSGTSALFVAGLRAVTAVPAHACFGIIMGSFLSLAKLSNKENKHSSEVLYLLLSVLIPSLIHSIYDYFLHIGSLDVIIFNFILVIILYIWCIKKIKKESNDNRFI